MRWFRKRELTPVQAAVPLFPLGTPRSGTTLLARLLNAHPAVLMTNETAIFVQLHENITKSRKGVTAGILYGKQYHDLWAEHLAQNARPLIEAYYEKIRRKARKGALRYWGEKHPHHHECLDFISELYPAARYIYIVRDPRDTACSIAEMRGTDFRSALENWRKFADRFEPFAAALPAARLFRLRYEDLVADYAGEARKMFAWLGLDYSPQVERFLAQYSDVDMHHIGSLRPPRRDFAAEAVGRAAREVPPEDLQFAEQLVGGYLQRYGYRAGMQPPQNAGLP